MAKSRDASQLMTLERRTNSEIRRAIRCAVARNGLVFFVGDVFDPQIGLRLIGHVIGKGGIKHSVIGRRFGRKPFGGPAGHVAQIELSRNAVREFRRKAKGQFVFGNAGQLRSGVSLIFCSFSISCPQSTHTYS